MGIITNIYLILYPPQLATITTLILKQEWGGSHGLLGTVNWYLNVDYFYGSPKPRRRVRASHRNGRELVQQASKSRLGRSRTFLRGTGDGVITVCVANAGRRLSNVEKMAVVSDRKGLLHNVMRIILH